jgi:hypothetical protein
VPSGPGAGDGRVAAWLPRSPTPIYSPPIYSPPRASARDAPAINDITVPVEVWVDPDGLVRRVSFEFRFGEITEVPGPEPRSYRPDAAFTVDLFDYGDESIDVELPTDAVDITDPFARRWSRPRRPAASDPRNLTPTRAGEYRPQP